MHTQQQIHPTDILLANKRSERGEFFVNLFEYCNLSCSFCWQDHDSKVGMDSIVRNADNVIRQIVASPLDGFDVNIMGGELFCDEINDDVFGDYEEFVLRIDEQAREHNKRCTYNWVTNLVYSDVDRVTALIDELRSYEIDTNLTTSYDSAGRFNKKTLRVFLNNLEKTSDYIKTIGVVLTKPTIERLLKDDDEVLKYLYKDFTLFFDYYSPEKNAEKMAPSDELLLKGLIFLVDNYPKAGPIYDWINNFHNKMTCRSSNVVLPTGETGKCRVLLNKEQHKDFSTPINFVSNNNMELTFIEKNLCISCEYFDRCGLGCYLHSDFLRRATLPECVFKMMFDYITKGIRPDAINT